MTKKNLDQEAFEYAEEYCATYGEYSTFREQLRMGISAYLRTTQRLVNSTKELKELSEFTHIIVGDTEFVKIGSDTWYDLDANMSSESGRIRLPATVIYKPVN